MSADPEGPGAPVPGRLAEMRRARAERAERLARLARLRGAGRTAAPPAEDPAALADFLRVLRAAAAEEPPAPMSDTRPDSRPQPAADAAPAAAVLRFLRAPERTAAPPPVAAGGRGDLDRLPGAGPGLVWALERAGIARLAELAEATPDALADRLGPVGALIDLAAWIGFARAASAPPG